MKESDIMGIISDTGARSAKSKIQNQNQDSAQTLIRTLKSLHTLKGTNHGCQDVKFSTEARARMLPRI